MKYLIVNGDDFGASRATNRGIVDAHLRGILTSTSLLVNRPWSEDAADLSRTVPHLGVGLHVDLGKTLQTSDPHPQLRDELHRQLSRFEELMGQRPTHLDSHHNIHRDPRALRDFVDVARESGLLLRDYSPVRYYPKFYGQWGGKTHTEHISPESIIQMLKTEIHEGFTELSCHPGYTDPEYMTGYGPERETELRTLCDSRVRQAVDQESIRLVSFLDTARLLVREPVQETSCRQS